MPMLSQRVRLKRQRGRDEVVGGFNRGAEIQARRSQFPSRQRHILQATLQPEQLV